MEKDNMGPLKDVKQVLLKVSKAFGIPIATVKAVSVKNSQSQQNSDLTNYYM